MWSRMTVATLLNRMTPSEVINSIMKNWVTYGGVPGDNILERLDEDFQEVQLSTKLACAGMAKNSLQMVYGYSPNQLVFGQNPLLPNISADGPPAWEEKTASEMIVKYLYISSTPKHLSRWATCLGGKDCKRDDFQTSEHIACSKESIHKLRKLILPEAALKSKIRTNGEILDYGDVVYYKRMKDDSGLGQRWLSFIMEKIIFVKTWFYLHQGEC